MATKDRIESATAQTSSTSQLCRLESLPVEINSLIFNSLHDPDSEYESDDDVEEIHRFPISSSLLPFTRSVTFHTILLSCCDSPKLQSLLEALDANPALVPLIKRISLYEPPRAWMAPVQEWHEARKQEEMILKLLPNLLMKTRVKEIHIKDWGAASNLVLEPEFLEQAGQSLEKIELNLIASLTFEQISHLRHLPNLLSLSITANRNARPFGWGEFIPFDTNLGGFQTLRHLTLNLDDFSGNFGSSLLLFFSTAPLQTIRIDQQSLQFECSTVLSVLPSTLVTSIELRCGSFQKEDLFENIVEFTSLEKLQILGNIMEFRGPIVLDSDESENDEIWEGEEIIPEADEHLDILLDLKKLRYLKYENENAYFSDLVSFLDKVNTPFEFITFSEISVGRIGTKARTGAVLQGMCLDNWARPDCNRERHERVTLEKLASFVRTAELKGVILDPNLSTAVGVHLAYEKEYAYRERAAAFIRPAWNAFLLAEKKLGYDVKKKDVKKSESNGYGHGSEYESGEDLFDLFS